ncbi:basic helix-loop-helix domain-containing protein USF3 [Lates japonicus]|uniref:Basic helix-loop-helix domain-containing protein USF3 n=1 Tax=Lates japonicus TaxID=270547 RepID=A0AAD3NLN4_LATJO|nr:basic helix-loop-helix domain-containing protein USF3 [Lates japonicus]
MGLHLQPVRRCAGAARPAVTWTHLGKANIAHNPQARLPADHPGSLAFGGSQCPPFKAMGAGGGGAHQLSGFEAQVSKWGDMALNQYLRLQRALRGSNREVQDECWASRRQEPWWLQPEHILKHKGYRLGQHCPGSRKVVTRVFMQASFPHLPEQATTSDQCSAVPSQHGVQLWYTRSSAGNIQAKASSPSVPQTPETICGWERTAPGAIFLRPPRISQHSRHIAGTLSTKLRPGGVLLRQDPSLEEAAEALALSFALWQMVLSQPMASAALPPACGPQNTLPSFYPSYSQQPTPASQASPQYFPSKCLPLEVPTKAAPPAQQHARLPSFPPPRLLTPLFPEMHVCAHRREPYVSSAVSLQHLDHDSGKHVLANISRLGHGGSSAV